MFITSLATLLLIGTNLESSLAQTPLPIKYTTGIHFDEKTPQPTFYERTANIVYKFKTPVWPTLWMNGTYSNGQHCSNDTYVAVGPQYHCPVDYHQDFIIRQMAPSIHVENMRIKSPSESTTAHHCDIIMSSFNGQYIEEEDFEEFLESLRICSGKHFHESASLEDYTSTDLEARHATLWGRYSTEYATKIPHSEPERHRLNGYVIGSKVIHDFLLVNYHIESKRWRDALVDCKAKTIPNTLVTPSRLNDTLALLESTLADDNLEFSIPAEYLTTYFKRPIADCVFTDDALVVHIQIPVKSISEWKLLEVRPLPFFAPKEGNISDEGICSVDNVQGSFVFDNRSRAAFPTQDCSLGELCHVLEATERPIEKSCATVSLLNESEYVPVLCNLKCQPIEYFQLPIFRKLASDTFVVTSTPGDQFVIQCPTLDEEESKSIEIIRFPEKGAVEVQLPCDCEILYDSLKIPARHPCQPGSKAAVYNLIPNHWT